MKQFKATAKRLDFMINFSLDKKSYKKSTPLATLSNESGQGEGCLILIKNIKGKRCCRVKIESPGHLVKWVE